MRKNERDEPFVVTIPPPCLWHDRGETIALLCGISLQSLHAYLRKSMLEDDGNIKNALGVHILDDIPKVAITEYKHREPTSTHKHNDVTGFLERRNKRNRF